MAMPCHQSGRGRANDSLLTVYQIIGSPARLTLDLTHFLHGCEQRVAAKLPVHRVDDLLDRVDDAQIGQSMVKEGMHGLLVRCVEHRGMLLRRA